MKKLLFVLLIFISISGYSQSKSQLEAQIKFVLEEQKKLTDELQSLKVEIADIRSAQQSLGDENQQLRSQLNGQKIGSEQNLLQPETDNKVLNPTTGKCQATTSKGIPCSRNAAAGSQYCWQHKGKSETNNAATSTPSATKSTSGSYTGSQTIQTGSRGGQYYINKNGNKTYVKRK